MNHPIDKDELAAWLRLLATPTLGRDAIRRLLTAFGSPQAAVQASPAALERVGRPALVAALAQPTPDVSAQLEATLAWLSETGTAARSIVTLGDPRYPARLLESSDPPLLLYAQGRLDLLAADAIAIVGSRNPTAQGAENARAFASNLSESGITVVSGLALGVDGAAHDGALSARGSTIGVVGTGLDRVYPRRHLELAHRISREGLLLSEYPLGAPPLAAHFPQRNRIIAGLSHGTLVVEAALPSGSLITARLALDAAREVFAIPGSIHSPQSRGCNALIKQGAKLVDCAQDILEELQLGGCPSRQRHMDMTSDSTTTSDDRSATSGKPDPVLDALGFEPMSLDELMARTGWPAHELSGHLLDLELRGRVARMPGQLFQRLVIV